MRIAIISDVHANVIALEVALKKINEYGYDVLYHLGDCINLGPFPVETIAALLQIPRARFIIGNHDTYFTGGTGAWQPKNPAESEHGEWSKAQLDSSIKQIMTNWPFVAHEDFEGLKVSFAHYGLTESETDFLPLKYDPVTDDLNELFSRYNSDLFIFGHIHKIVSRLGNMLYLNPGSVGVNNRGHVPFIMLDVQSDGKYEVTQYQVPYDDSPVIRAFEERKVPNREQIITIFY